MVFMPVSEDDPGQPVLLAFDELEVGKDKLDAGIGRVGEREPEVDHDPLAAAAVEIDVHADLARAAQRDEQQFFAGNHCADFTAMAYSRLNPWMVRSGSIASNRLVCLSNRCARPPVATTVAGPPSSRFMRSTSPSIIAT